jgi:chaperone BCS1
MEYCRDYEDVKSDDRSNNGQCALTTNERVELTVAVDDGMSLLMRFMDHVRAEKAASDTTVIWVQQMNRLVVSVNDKKAIGWYAKPTHSTKTFDTVVLDAEMKADLIADLRAFLDGEKWYASMGLAYKRGYLLHGPPGTGKSSVVLAIAGMASANIYNMNLSLIRNDTDLDNAFAAMPNKCVVVFEDIDCMGANVALTRTAEPAKKRIDDKETNKESKEDVSTLTLSCLLNHLDGSGANHGRIFVMTTNHPERLDPALVRPGRTDVNLRLGLCSRQQIGAFFALFYPDQPTPARLAALPDNTLSPAEVSCMMLQYRNSPDIAVERLYTMSSPP